jgi:ABC-type sugar transport system ATPase subunit
VRQRARAHERQKARAFAGFRTIGSRGRRLKAGRTSDGGRLLETIVELKRHGVTQIIISHRMTDIFEVGDSVMVLKRGRNVGTRAIPATTEKEVLELIVSGVPEAAPEAELAA